MKKLALIILVVFYYSTSLNAQNIVDDNTEKIQNYFLYQENNLNSQNISSKEINIYQQGENNNLEISTSGKKIQLVKQVGDDNNYQYNTYYNSSKANLVINQFGDENDIQIYGHNSIVEKLKITQTTNNQNILIFNF